MEAAAAHNGRGGRTSQQGRPADPPPGSEGNGDTYPDPHRAPARPRPGPEPVAAPGVRFPRQRQAPRKGPRQEYLDAFADESGEPVTVGPADGGEDDDLPSGKPAQQRGGRGRTYVGAAAAAVTTVLAVVVAGQVTQQAQEDDAAGVQAQSAVERARDAREGLSSGDEPEEPAVPPVEPLTYQQKMDRKYPLGEAGAGTGKFDAIPGIDKAPGKGVKVTYRVDVEQGLGLDGELFAKAVHRTLNDNRSWAHNGARTFERVHSGRVDWVITLAGPETTGVWCAKSGLDTTQQNVSCDSAATSRVMINADRWAQGSETYGDDIHGYRQMLINHEVGHRLGHNHLTCDKDGDLAPAMQQQTKFLEHNGIRCRANPWPYPNG